MAPEQHEASSWCHLRPCSGSCGRVVGSASSLQSSRLPLGCALEVPRRIRRPEWPRALRVGLPQPCPLRGSGGLSDGQAQLQAVDHKSPNCWILGVTHVSRTGSLEGGTGTRRSQSLLVGLWALCSSAGGLALVDTAVPSSGTFTSALALPREPRRVLGPSGMQAPWLWGAAWHLVIKSSGVDCLWAAGGLWL